MNKVKLDFGLKKRSRVAIGVCVATIAVIILAALVGLSHDIRTSIEDSVKMTIINVTEQSAKVVYKDIISKQEFLQALAQNITDEYYKDEDACLHRISILAKAYGMDQIGVLTPDGMCHMENNKIIDLRTADYLSQVFSGQPIITKSFSYGDESEEYVNVFAIPAEVDNHIPFVLIATYLSDDFSESLKTDSFGGIGKSVVVDSEGRAVVTTSDSNQNSNDSIVTYIYENPEIAANQGNGNFFKFSYDGETYLSCMKEIGINDWYVLTYVDKTTVFQEANLIQKSVLSVSAVLLFIIVTTLTILILILSRYKKNVHRFVFVDEVLKEHNYEYLKALYETLSDAQKENLFLAVMDIDGFKALNMSYGNDMGDEILRYIGQAFKESCPDDEIYRRYSDHFAALMQGESQDIIENKLDLLLHTIQTDIELKRVIPFTLSIGVSRLDGVQHLYSGYTKAMLAKSSIKGNYLNQYAFFEDYLRQVSVRNMELSYRVSTKGQVDHDDIPMQKIACRKFAQEHGWRVVLEKAEKGVSGSKVSANKRDVIQELRSEAGKGNFDILLVYMFDRLGRIESETPFVLEWFVQHGIQMWSTHEGQQRIESHGDKLMNYIRFWQAAGESEKTSMRTRDRIRQLVSSGHFAGGFVPYGYRAVNKGRVNKRDQPVKDLEINPDEAEWVREVFMKVAEEGASGYAMAQMLNQRGLRTRQGAEFQSSNIKRMIQHEGYTGYIITKAARSEFMPQLQIIDEALFAKANEMISKRSKKALKDKNAAQKSSNPTLLAGIVVCAHCGAKMSAFLHKDRYKLADGSIRERVQAKYNCYQRGQHLRECDGQALYLAERVDRIVLAYVDELFRKIKSEPYDKSIEQRIRQQDAEHNRQKQAAEKKIKAAQYKQQRYEDEVLKCLDGTSVFSQEMLARLIAQAEAEVRQAKDEYATLLQNNDHRATVQQIRNYYNEFLGWANEFDLASVPRKRAILAELFEKVEVGRGYKVTIHVKGSYKQFLKIE